MRAQKIERSTVLLRGLLFFMVLAAILGLGLPGLLAAQDPCEVEDNGSGTVTLPPEGCEYLSPQAVHMIIDGLPPGTTIELAPIHRGFFCRGPGLRGPCLVEAGGGLGGQREVFDSVLAFELTGTGSLAGFRRIVSLPATVETHTAPRNPGDPVQSFDTQMFQLQGALFGDPDFAQLQVMAGNDFGLSSPGHTTLTDLGDGTFHVDSFFDITYQIEFVGAPGGALDGLSGTTQGTTRVEARGERDPCTAPDDGSGTVELPPAGCDYLSPQEVHEIINGLPPGTTIELAPRHAAFVCLQTGGCGVPGGTLGGEVELFSSTLVLQLSGTGALGDFRRTLRVPVEVETHTGPRNPGDPVQSFPTEMVSLQGSLFGDPDFATLTVTGGSANGLPSPGHTILEELGSGDFNVDSFFDVTYRIDFEGAPGSQLEGLAGTTTSTIRMEAHSAKTDSVEPDDGQGTVVVPPEGSQYVSAQEVHMILDGLPPSTTIELAPSHRFFFCETTPCGTPGGSLGGEIERFGSTLNLELRGTGALVDFRRRLTLPVQVETHTGPRGSGVTVPIVAPPANAGKGVLVPPPQSFATDMASLQGSLFGDRDFASLQITGGTDNGMPSPGHTTLVDRGDGTFTVDSFFDVAYRIDFVGAPGGRLAGMSGSTEGSVRVTACDDPNTLPRNITIVEETEGVDGHDFAFSGDLGLFSLDDDADPVLPQKRRFPNLRPNFYLVTETMDPEWTLLRLFCDDPDGGTIVDKATGEAAIELDLGESITCTFTNVRTVDHIFSDGFESGDVSAWTLSRP